MTAIYSVAVLVVFRILLTAIGFALFCWAFYKLVWFVQIQGFVFNVPQVCLALEIIANLCTSEVSCFTNMLNLTRANSIYCCGPNVMSFCVCIYGWKFYRYH
jgi:hypothetical protein